MVPPRIISYIQFFMVFSVHMGCSFSPHSKLNHSSPETEGTDTKLDIAGNNFIHNSTLKNSSEELLESNDSLLEIDFNFYKALILECFSKNTTKSQPALKLHTFCPGFQESDASRSPYDANSDPVFELIKTLEMIQQEYKKSHIHKNVHRKPTQSNFRHSKPIGKKRINGNEFPKKKKNGSTRNTSKINNKISWENSQFHNNTNISSIPNIKMNVSNMNITQQTNSYRYSNDWNTTHLWNSAHWTSRFRYKGPFTGRPMNSGNLNKNPLPGSHKLQRRDLPNYQSFPASTSSSSVPNKQIKPPDDLYLLVPDLIREFGYPAEVHEIMTKDGYYLTLHRIVGTRREGSSLEPGSSNEIKKKKKKVVLVMHGLASSSADFIIGGPDSALGFMLADAGYDVWLGNFRGNTYSKKHQSLDTNGPDFWKFSLDDLAQRDIPAMLEHIIRSSGSEKVHYIGHSLGATVFTMAADVRPGIAERIRYFAAMAPIGYGKKSMGPVKTMTNLARISYKRKERAQDGSAEILARDRHSMGVMWFFCNARSIFWKLCLTLITSAAGRNNGLFRKEMLPYILAHLPAGTSVRLAAHVGQLLSSDGVQFFDFGVEGNEEKYKRASPPSYDMSYVTCPTAIYWAQNDFLAPAEDVQQFIESLPNVILKQEIGHETFNHYDFVYSNQARHLVHTDLIKEMQKHE